MGWAAAGPVDELEANQKLMMRPFATMGLGFAGIVITLLIKLPLDKFSIHGGL